MRKESERERSHRIIKETKKNSFKLFLYTYTHTFFVCLLQIWFIFLALNFALCASILIVVAGKLYAYTIHITHIFSSFDACEPKLNEKEKNVIKISMLALQCAPINNLNLNIQTHILSKRERETEIERKKKKER